MRNGLSFKSEVTMKQLERMIKEELLKAPKELCLSIYVPPGSPEEKKSNLNDLIVEACDYIQKTLTITETENFLRPLHAMSKRDLERLEGSIAIFRAKSDFRCLTVPMALDKECIVSNHYNVKPLLRWLQEEHNFICVDFAPERVDILEGDAESFASLGCFGLRPQDFSEIDSCIENKASEGDTATVYVCGERSSAQAYLNNTRLRRIDPSVIEKSAYSGDYTRLWEMLNDRTRHKALRKVKKSLMDFNLALIKGNGREDLREIIEAAKNRKIKKLIVSEDQRIWGRIDAYNEPLNRVNKQINYEDDDLLDSLSESVIVDGGEVVLASSKQLPRGKSCLAILKEAI